MGKPSAERRQEIIEATLELAAELGAKRVTTQAIADRVRIAQPTVFRHFKNRDEIFSAAIGFVAERLLATLEGAVSSDDPADVRLHRLIRRQLGFVAGQRGLPRLLFSDRLHLESPHLKKAVQRVMQRYRKRVSALLAEGVESGCFRTDLDPDEAAGWVTALIQGLILRWSIFEFEFDLAKEADKLWAFVRPALARPG